jgi:hypothetical protein
VTPARPKREAHTYVGESEEESNRKADAVCCPYRHESGQHCMLRTGHDGPHKNLLAVLSPEVASEPFEQKRRPP